MRRRTDDWGANLVEFAILAPLLILLLFGIIEFAWAFAQNLNVRHGAREGARLAAVDFTPNIVSETCSRMDIVSGASVTFLGTDLDATPGLNPGDEVAATVDAPLNQITGFFTAWLPSDLTSTVAIRIEQPPTGWASGVTTPC